jgi:hypothetical protein
MLLLQMLGQDFRESQGQGSGKPIPQSAGCGLPWLAVPLRKARGGYPKPFEINFENPLDIPSRPLSEFWLTPFIIIHIVGYKR